MVEYAGKNERIGRAPGIKLAPLRPVGMRRRIKRKGKADHAAFGVPFYAKPVEQCI